MSRKSQSAKTPGMMLGIFLVILIAYLSYIFLLHPWERKSLLTQKSNITINVVDCDSGFPINNATVYIYNEEKNLIKQELSTNGKVVYSDFPDCFWIKVSFDEENFEGVCIGSGEEKVLNFCYEYPQANPQVLHYEGGVGVIGGTSGEVINENKFGSFILSYPLSNTTITYPSRFLYSNILWSEGMAIEVSSIDENITKSLNLDFTLESKRGSPAVKVYANNKLLFNEEVDDGGNVSVMIPKQELNETMKIELKCDFTGWFFWTTQDCNLTGIQVTQEFYTPKKVSQEFFFSTSTIEQEADTFELMFNSNGETTGGISASINGYQVFNSNSLLAVNYSTSVPTSSIDIKDTNNSLKFEANPSAEVLINNASIRFRTPITGTNSKNLNFYITESELNSLDKILISFFVEDVYFNGLITLNINDVAMYCQRIDSAGWNTISIEKKDLLSENYLVMSAPEGRFEIGKLKISYE
jgi:hypothetical protein